MTPKALPASLRNRLLRQVLWPVAALWVVAAVLVSAAAFAE